ncbi:MAG: hypothetical protein ABSG53_13540 [Thermoguttaceae bacterium]|jgi:hypothetical protein
MVIPGFKQWLLLREHFSAAAYDELYNQQLAALVPKLRDPEQRRGLAAMRDMRWSSYIAASLRNAGFRHQGQLEELIHDVTVKLLLAPGGLFRDYDPQRHGPFELRFRASVGNAVRNIVEKDRNRARYLRPVPLDVGWAPGSIDAASLPARPEPVDDPTLINQFRGLLKTRLGRLATAIFDARLAGEQTKSLVGRASLGVPSELTVKKTVQAIKDAAREFAQTLDDPAFLRQVARLMAAEAATVERRKATTRQKRLNATL